METIDYEKQAEDFLSTTSTQFHCKYLKTDRYFPTDKDKRDIYEITLTRGNRSYTFTFGQSLNNSGKWTMDITAQGYTKGQPLTDEEYKKARPKFHSWGKWCSHNTNFEAPSSYDVLSCVEKYDPGSFEDFCSEFGYDADSRRAEDTYKAVKDQYQNICMLYTDVELELLQEIN